ncbi:unnamed protein product [Vicia faba]|uniref:RING-type E3 ubiquitin transferase n=1 Tax=Vicia faba TaxID=3906 RepID=A0AAV0Z4I5_VICFA|nr:unnamed protein product [Vicia faba]
MDYARGSPRRIRRNRQSPYTLARSSASSSNGVATKDNASLPFQPLFNIQAPNTNESLLESANMGFERSYNETIGIRFSHRSPLFRHQRRRYDLPTIPMHGVPPSPPPHGAVVPPQDIAILNEEVENPVDPYRGMRLNIEDMSYEELLALGESIGSVNTSLSEETITALLKTKSYRISINLEELPSDDQESDTCIICQEYFEIQENIGVLACEHVFHVGCITQWLLIKNKCPICKSEALSPTNVE